MLFFGIATSCHTAKKEAVKPSPSNSKTVVTTPATPRPRPVVTPPDAHGSVLLETAYSWLGTPYLWGGNDKEGVDCSGFVLQVYLKATGIGLPRTSAQQAEWCAKADPESLEVGDLMFFTGKDSTRVSHVGMYVGEGKMIHSSSSRGVVIDRLDTDYWVRHLHSAGRVPGLAKAPTPQKTTKPKPRPAPVETVEPVIPVQPPPVVIAKDETDDPQTIVKNAFAH